MRSPSVTALRALFWYEDGKVFYVRTGREAVAKTRNGYRAVYIKREMFLAHRVIWALYYGSWPDGILDHIDGDKLNNDISNLRVVSYSLNSHNKAEPQTRSKTGVRGVSMDGNKFHARITVNGRLFLLGNYATCEEAEISYLQAKRKYVGDVYARQ